jgi:hypothetical protein
MGVPKLPQMSPQSWFEPQVGYPYGFPSGPEIHRYHPDRKGVFTTKLSPSVCAEPFEACQSEVVGVNWVDGPFGCGDQIDRHLEDLKSLQTRLIRIFRKLCCRARWNSPARREIFYAQGVYLTGIDMRRSVLLRKLVSTLIRSTQSLKIWSKYVELTQ